MSREQGVTNAVQEVLAKWVFPDPTSLPEQFAQKRFAKKFELPDESAASDRRERCFVDYISFDSHLTRPPGLLPRKWYLARDRIHKILSRFSPGSLVITNGSEVTPTRGYNSIESKLRKSEWYCTFDCLDQWAELAYSSPQLRRAVRRRLARVFSYDQSSIRDFHRESWQLCKNRANASFLCFRRSLLRVTRTYSACRFSTVPKNNTVDRPIALEGVANMCVQRSIGQGLRTLMKREFSIDLDALADTHRWRIQDKSLATIDLSNASDSVSLWLCEFLFPRWFFTLLQKSRAPYLEGLDGQYHVLNKVSSMGCGFTFELMSLILYCVGIEYDPEMTVFGDDIIIKNEHAASLISDLEHVGFVVNKDKSFINSKFRESCGANYHDDYGYIRSFDFRYPRSIHDCIVLTNKAFVLGGVYPSFRALWERLIRVVPLPLQGPPRLPQSRHHVHTPDQDLDLGSYFFSDVSRREDGIKCKDRRLVVALELIHCLPVERVYRAFIGYTWAARVATPRRDHLIMKRDFGKYSMYLQGCRRVDDVISGQGRWQPVTWIQVGQRAFRAKDLLATYSDGYRSQGSQSRNR